MPDELHKIRRFRCSDELWDICERLATERGQSLDELVVGALRELVRQQTPGVGGSVHPQSTPARRGSTRSPSEGPPRGRAPLGGSSLPPPVPQRPVGPPPLPPPARLSPPPPAPLTGSLRPAASGAWPTVGQGVGSLPPMTSPPRAPSASLGPPPPPTVGGTRPRAGGHAVTLWLTYGGARFPVDKDRFIIGRVKAQSDLVIKDPNVSRQHAAIERRGGDFVIQDLGSTNGVVVRGQRIERHAIRDGDAISICDHEIRFTFE